MIRDDRLPNLVCTDCCNELERYYAFRKRCEISYQKLKSHILAIKERGTNKNTVLDNKEISHENNQVENLPNGAMGGQHLVLAYNDDEQLQIVDIVNFNGVQVDDSTEKLTELTNSNEVRQDVEVNQMQNYADEVVQKLTDLTNNNEAIQDVEENQIQTQDASESPSPPLHSASPADLTGLLSVLLIELGVVTQHEDRLALVQNIRTLELEGGDGCCVTLELAEEDEEFVKSEDIVRCQEEIPIERENSVNAMVGTFYLDNKQDNVAGPNGRNGQIKDGKDKSAAHACATCGKRLSCASALSRHALVHSRARPHACRCGRAFAQRAVLRRHELLHRRRDQRPFRCARCPRSYTQRAALQAHARRHAAATAPAAAPRALHRCRLCAKVFLYSSGLSRHAKVHSGSVYTCNECGRSFGDRSALLRHLRSSCRGVPALTPTTTTTRGQ